MTSATAPPAGPARKGARPARTLVLDPNEYAEMVEFATTLARGVTALPDSPESAALAKDAQSLVDAVARKSDAAQIRVITARMQAQLLQGYHLGIDI